jgi:WD40 repeat protein
VWDLIRRRELATLRRDVDASCVALSATGKLAIIGGRLGSLEVHVLEGSTKVARFDAGEHIKSIRLTEDDRHLVCRNLDGAISVWAIEDVTLQWRSEHRQARASAFSISSDVNCFAFAKLDSSTAKVWDLSRCTEKSRLGGQGEPIRDLSIGDHGRRCVTVDGYNFRVWDLESGVCLRTIAAPESKSCALATASCVTAVGGDWYLRFMAVE